MSKKRLIKLDPYSAPLDSYVTLQNIYSSILLLKLNYLYTFHSHNLFSWTLCQKVSMLKQLITLSQLSLANSAGSRQASETHPQPTRDCSLLLRDTYLVMSESKLDVCSKNP